MDQYGNKDGWDEYYEKTAAVAFNEALDAQQGKSATKKYEGSEKPDRITQALADGMAVFDVTWPLRLITLDIDNRVITDGLYAPLWKYTDNWISTVSKSMNRHIYALVKPEYMPRNMIERAFLQAHMGSDHIREMLSLEQLSQDGSRGCWLMFETVEYAPNVFESLAAWGIAANQITSWNPKVPQECPDGMMLNDERQIVL